MRKTAGGEPFRIGAASWMLAGASLVSEGVHVARQVDFAHGRGVLAVVIIECITAAVVAACLGAGWLLFRADGRRARTGQLAHGSLLGVLALAGLVGFGVPRSALLEDVRERATVVTAPAQQAAERAQASWDGVRAGHYGRYDGLDLDAIRSRRATLKRARQDVDAAMSAIRDAAAALPPALRSSGGPARVTEDFISGYEAANEKALGGWSDVLRRIDAYDVRLEILERRWGAWRVNEQGQLAHDLWTDADVAAWREASEVLRGHGP